MSSVIGAEPRYLMTMTEKKKTILIVYFYPPLLFKFNLPSANLNGATNIFKLKAFTTVNALKTNAMTTLTYSLYSILHDWSHVHVHAAVYTEHKYSLLVSNIVFHIY